MLYLTYDATTGRVLDCYGYIPSVEPYVAITESFWAEAGNNVNNITIVNGVAEYNLNYYKSKKLDQLQAIKNANNKILVEDNSYVDVQNTDLVLIHCKYCQIHQNDDVYKLTVKDTLTNENKIKNVVANADYQQLLNNICCARSQFENLINETAYLINSATTREEVDTLQLPTDFSFLDIRG